MNQNTEQPKKNIFQTKRQTIFPTKILAEITIFVALAGALALISHSFFGLPQGGSINLGMVPIFWLALRRGPKIGIFAGAVFGVVDLAIEPFVVNPAQFMLDYPLGVCLPWTCRIFPKTRSYRTHCWCSCWRDGRFLSHFISGVIYFPQYAPAGMSPIALLSNIQWNLHGAQAL